MKKFIALIAVVLLATMPLTAAYAARFERGESITITEQELVPHNLYLAGRQITFSSTAQKDLVGAGGKVIVNGAVWGDALVAGGTVDVLENVRGDVRVAGGQITIQGVISGDVMVAGGAVAILPGTTIGGDLVVFGGEVSVDGAVGGQTKIYAGKAMLNGTFAGPVFATVQESLAFGDKTIIGSTLNYRSAEEATVAAGAKLGDKVTYTALDIPRVDRGTVAAVLLGIVTLLVVVKLVSLGLASALAATFLTNFSRSVADESITRFWQSLLSGLAALVITPIVAIVLIATLIGMYLGFVLFALYCLVLVLAAVYSPIVAGGIISKLIYKQIMVDWRWALVGTAVLFLIWLIPVFGWLVSALAYLLALGALALHVFRAGKSRLS